MGDVKTEQDEEQEVTPELLLTINTFIICRYKLHLDPEDGPRSWTRTLWLGAWLVSCGDFVCSTLSSVASGKEGFVQKSLALLFTSPAGGAEEVQRGRRRRVSSRARRSSRAARSTEDLRPRTAWCPTGRSNECRRRSGTSGCPRSNSSTSRRDSASRRPWTA